MFKNFNWKKFFISTIITATIFLGADILLDYLKGKLVWADIFSFNNIALKVLSGIILGYFIGSSNKEEKE
jgi:hypothetical protein